VTRAVTFRGFVNAHSHAFQRALRGRTVERDFWAWRNGMLAEAERHTPASVRELYTRTYLEMRAAGFTAVGEFHYLGVDTALAAAEAAEEAGVAFVCLHVAYARGGLERMRQPSIDAYVTQLGRLRDEGVAVGVAPHSVRACPREWLDAVGAFAASEGLVLHVHADEHPREVEECLAEHGMRPIELLAECGCLGERTTVVHATHANGTELDLLRDTGSTICVCPTTEADLGDGFVPAVRIRHRGIPLCIGSDSNVRIDPFEELRELEGIARRQVGRRGVFATDELWEIGGANGARSLGLGEWADVDVDVDHPSLAGVAPEHVQAALVAGCAADVVLPRG
jgi:formimidoylglutamate deiminase